MISILSHDFIPVEIYVKDHTENFRHLLRMVLRISIWNGSVLMIDESLKKIIVCTHKNTAKSHGYTYGDDFIV